MATARWSARRAARSDPRQERNDGRQPTQRCDVLNLVLGLLDLDLLGLEASLNRVVLDIVAMTGAGNLLNRILGLLG